MTTMAFGSKEYFIRLFRLRYFLFSLVRNDIRSRYRRSFLGLGWSLIRPLSMTVVMCVVFQKVFQIPNSDYVPFVLIGMATWQFLTECILGGCRSILNGAAYLRQQPVPLAIFPLRTVLGNAFHGMIALTMGLAVTWYFRGFGNLPAVVFLFLPSLILLLILGWFFAIVSSIFQVHFPDTNHLLEVFLQLLFYLTPIIFQPSLMLSWGRLGWIVRCNPFYHVLELVRRPVLFGLPPSLESVLVTFGFVAVMGLLAFFFMRRNERHLVFWI
jgi:lipopolysaccharide transport system permease protein